MAGEREHAQLMKRLNVCLKRPENLVCADCPMRLPRWASLNLGIFMCTNCSGIHRGLGVHISRVRSTQLDKWTEQQVAFIERMGNVRANAYWEANLPAGAKPKVSDLHVVERYIRDKYERKMYADKNCDGPIPGDASGTPAAPAAAPAPVASAPAPAAGPAAGGGMFDLLELADPLAQESKPAAAPAVADNWAFTSVSVAATNANGTDGEWDAFASAAPVPAPTHHTPAPAASAADDDWAAFASAAPVAAAAAVVPTTASASTTDDWGAFTDAPAAATVSKPEVSKNDIMSLFDAPQPAAFGGGAGGGMIGGMGNGMGGMQGMPPQQQMGGMQGMSPQQQMRGMQGMMMPQQQMRGMQGMMPPQQQMGGMQGMMMPQQQMGGMQGMMMPQQQMGGTQGMMMPQQQMGATQGMMMPQQQQQQQQHFGQLGF